jgi:hypothetical protein
MRPVELIATTPPEVKKVQTPEFVVAPKPILETLLPRHLFRAIGDLGVNDDIYPVIDFVNSVEIFLRFLTKQLERTVQGKNEVNNTMLDEVERIINLWDSYFRDIDNLKAERYTLEDKIRESLEFRRKKEIDELCKRIHVVENLNYGFATHAVSIFKVMLGKFPTPKQKSNDSTEMAEPDISLRIRCEGLAYCLVDKVMAQAYRAAA